MGACKHKTFSFHTRGGFLYYLSDYQLIKIILLHLVKLETLNTTMENLQHEHLVMTTDPLLPGS